MSAWDGIPEFLRVVEAAGFTKAGKQFGFRRHMSAAKFAGWKTG